MQRNERERLFIMSNNNNNNNSDVESQLKTTPKTSAVVGYEDRGDGKVAPLPAVDEETGVKYKPPAGAAANEAKIFCYCTKKWAIISAVIVVVVLLLALVIGVSVKLTRPPSSHNSTSPYHSSYHTSVPSPTTCTPSLSCSDNSDCCGGYFLIMFGGVNPVGICD